jgi:hypothetical protein
MDPLPSWETLQAILWSYGLPILCIVSLLVGLAAPAERDAEQQSQKATGARPRQ